MAIDSKKLVLGWSAIMFNRDPNSAQIAVRFKADVFEALKTDPNSAQVAQTLERFILDEHAVTSTGSLLKEGLVLYFHTESSATEFRIKLDENRVTQSVWPVSFGPAKIIAPGETYVFISHASEDKALAEQLARGLGARGIDTFIDSDDITGDASFTAHINQALAACTHFVALLTPVAAGKPWVKHELLVITSRVVKGEVAFFALATQGYTATMFQNQFATLAHVRLQPFADVTEILPQLLSDVLALARKPPNGPLPLVATKPDGHGLSKAAYVLAEWLITRSKKAQEFDPQVDIDDELRFSMGISQLDLEDAIAELESLGCVAQYESSESWEVTAKAELFARFDQHYMSWNPADDALMMATRLMSAGARGSEIHADKLAAEFDWAPRRINPAIQWLLSRKLIEREQAWYKGDFIQARIAPNSATRQFVSFDPHMPQKSLGSP